MNKWMIFFGVFNPPIFGNISTWGKMFPPIFDERQSPRSELEDEIDLGFEGAEVSEDFFGEFCFFWRKKWIFSI